MRITKFYKKPEDELKYDKTLRTQDKYPLYAIALNKKDSKEFIRTRNMDKFIESTEELEGEEINQAMESINKNPALRTAVLDRYKLKTYIDKYTDDVQTPAVEFLMTQREHQQVLENTDECILILSSMWWDQWAREVRATTLLKPKYQEALEILDFNIVKKLILEDHFVNPNELVAFQDWDDRMNLIEWDYDQLLVFMRMFQWSVKIKE